MPKYFLILSVCLIAFFNVSGQNNAKEITVFTSGNLQLLKAKITDKITGKASSGVRGYVTVPGSPFQLRSSVSDDNGNLYFAMTDMQPPRHLIFETDTKKDSNYVFTLSRPLLQQYPAEPLVDSSEHEPDTLAFYGRPDKIYLLDDYVRFPTLEEVFREYVVEVRVSKAKTDYKFSVLNSPFRTYFDDEPLILLDGVPIFDYQQLLALDPLKISKMEIVARKYFYGSLVCNGIVSLFTYAGDLGGYALHPNALLFEYD